jgi:hypothetical protein
MKNENIKLREINKKYLKQTNINSKMAQFENFRQFLVYMENNYDEEQQLIIEGFMSYYINEYNGYGKQNCKQSYEEDLNNDKTGELHRLALIGFEFEKKLSDQRKWKKEQRKLNKHK